MTSWRRLFEVARRDLLQRGKSKVFLVTTALLVTVILGGAPLVASQVDEVTSIEIGVVGSPGEALVSSLDGAAAGLGVDYALNEFADRDAGEVGLRDGDVSALIDGYAVVWESSTGPITNALVSGALMDTRRLETGEALGLAPGEVVQLLAPEPPETVILEAPDGDQGARQGAAYLGTVLLFMSVVLFGQFVLLGVLEEKSSRVAEVVLSRVRPIELLAGKVIGIGLLGLAQLMVIGGSLVLAANMVDVADLPNLSGIGLSVVSTVILWYILGYALYSVLYAAAGSLVSRQEDVQGVSWIPMIALLPAYFIALAASFNPDTVLVRVASMAPATAPMVMPVRASASTVPAWEYAVAIIVTLATTYLLIRLAGRIYQGGILQSGRVKLRDAWRSAES